MSNDDPYAAVTPAPALTVRSDDLKHGEEIPLIFRDPQIGGTNTSPHLAWSDFPAQTQSFALTCYDPDAPTGTGFMHWAVANIPSDVSTLPAGTYSNITASYIPGGTGFTGSTSGVFGSTLTVNATPVFSGPTCRSNSASMPRLPCWSHGPFPC